MTDIIKLITTYAYSDGDIRWEELPEDFDIVEEGDWTQDHKYQHSEGVVRHKDTNRFFRISRSRYGSYHTSWYYGEAHVCEVERREETITITKWVAV